MPFGPRQSRKSRQIRSKLTFLRLSCGSRGAQGHPLQTLSRTSSRWRWTPPKTEPHRTTRVSRPDRPSPTLNGVNQAPRAFQRRVLGNGSPQERESLPRVALTPCDIAEQLKRDRLGHRARSLQERDRA